MQTFIYKGKLVPVNYTVKSSVVKSKAERSSRAEGIDELSHERSKSNANSKKMVQTTLSGELRFRAEGKSEANKIELNCTCPPTKSKEKE